MKPEIREIGNGKTALVFPRLIALTDFIREHVEIENRLEHIWSDVKKINQNEFFLILYAADFQEVIKPIIEAMEPDP